jgi:hypothetical protein
MEEWDRLSQSEEESMTTDGTEYLIRCYAYNKAGQRCEQLAGHDGKHALVTEWSDAECWTPLSQREPIQFASPAPVVLGEQGHAVLLEDGVEQITGSGRCGICEHPHHPGGVCGADDHGYDCDCSNSVED